MSMAAAQLRCFIERIERLQIDKSVISAEITGVFGEAAGNGFDPKTMRHVIRLRAMTPAQREEHEALVDIYKASLGMLGGTPLGEAAIRRLNKPQRELFDQQSLKEEKEEKPQHRTDEKEQPATKHPEPEPVTEAPPPPPEPTIEEAREMGRKAAAEGKPVTDNPFPARDPRRAAFDEEWCRSAGSDGMDLPEAWKRTKKKDKDGKQDGGTD